MPLTKIWLRKGQSAEHLKAVQDAIYGALRETFDVPEGNRFMIVTQCDENELCYGASYLGIERGPGFTVIQITCNNTRSLEQKKALYKSIAERLSRCGVRPEDVFINLVEVPKENWSLGLGIAQYA